MTYRNWGNSLVIPGGDPPDTCDGFDVTASHSSIISTWKSDTVRTILFFDSEGAMVKALSGSSPLTYHIVPGGIYTVVSTGCPVTQVILDIDDFLVANDGMDTYLVWPNGGIANILSITVDGESLDGFLPGKYESGVIPIIPEAGTVVITTLYGNVINAPLLSERPQCFTISFPEPPDPLTGKAIGFSGGFEELDQANAYLDSISVLQGTPVRIYFNRIQNPESAPYYADCSDLVATNGEGFGPYFVTFSPSSTPGSFWTLNTIQAEVDEPLFFISIGPIPATTTRSVVSRPSAAALVPRHAKQRKDTLTPAGSKAVATYMIATDSLGQTLEKITNSESDGTHVIKFKNVSMAIAPRRGKKSHCCGKDKKGIEIRGIRFKPQPGKPHTKKLKHMTDGHWDHELFKKHCDEHNLSVHLPVTASKHIQQAAVEQWGYHCNDGKCGVSRCADCDP